jgi:hypothetical protein
MNQGVSSFKPSQGADQMEAREKVAGGFFIARGDASKLFDVLEKTFDQVAFGI